MQGLVTVASVPRFGGGLAVNRSSVYWSEQNSTSVPGAYAIVKASKCGGPATTLASGSGGVGGLAVDSCNVYWFRSTGGPGTPATTYLLSTPVGGGSTVTLAAADGAIGAMTIDATSAYWIAWGDMNGGNGDGAIVRAPLTGGQPTTLAADQILPYEIAVRGGNVYWSASDGVTGYGYDGQILTVPIGGGVPRVFGGQSARGSPQGGRGLAINSTTLFWAASNTTWIPGGYYNSIAAVDAEPLGGGATTTLVSAQGWQLGPGASATMFTTYGAMVADDGNLYFFRNVSPPMGPLGTDDLLQLPLGGGGSPVTLASGLSAYLSALTVDATSLYWEYESADGGAILSLTPK